jgi:tetratricopeptide (TPR) repeat protein
MSWNQHITDGISAVRAFDYASAEQSFKQALQYAKTHFSRVDERLSLTLSLLGHTYFRTEDFKRAELLLEQSLRLQVESESFIEPCLLMDMFSLGEIKRCTGKRLEACRLYDQTINRLRDNGTGTLAARQARGHFAQRLETFVSELSDEERGLIGQVDEPQETKEQTPEEVEENAARDDTAYGAALHSVDNVEPHTETVDAQPESGSSTDSAMFELWHQQLNNGLSGLHDVDEEEESWVSAYLHLESALRLAHKLFPSSDERLIRTLKALADASAKLHLWEQAEALYREAIACAKRADDNTSVDALRLHLALFYVDFDQLHQAKRILESVKMTSSTGQSPYSEGLISRVEKACRLVAVYDTVQSLVRQAQSAEEQKDLEKAAKLTNNALTTLRQGFSPSHPETARVLRYRSQLLRDMGNLEQSDELASRAERIERANEGNTDQWSKRTEDLPKPDLGVPV